AAAEATRPPRRDGGAALPASAAPPAPRAASGSAASVASASPGPSAPFPAGPDATYLLREIQAVSQALRHPDDIQAVRARAAAPAESISTHD
ncbi:hypothetical protein PV663_21195, partial [Streptomyces sp. FL07-04A]|nr:hypothetical protein [Streptomyces sp. FL07-04A]